MVVFAVVCVGVGFMLATGFNTPAKLKAQIGSGPQAMLAGAQLPLLDEEGNSPFVNVAEKVKPVVVNIQAEKEADSRTVPFDIFDFGPFFGRPPNRGYQRKMPKMLSGGSGIIVDESGLIMTNNHVISDANDITVKFSDGVEKKAKIIGSDPETDVALIKVDEKIPSAMVARLGDSDKIRIGEWAIAVGNPFGLDWTVTVGVISARGRSNLNIGGIDGETGPSYQDFIQTDASINFGNSGGPLLNIHGEVIGINTAINAQGQGLGFAIPINMARKIAEQLQQTGEVKRGFLGVVPRDLDEMTREALGLDKDFEGVFIESVQEKTPAAEGGLKGGEIITEIEDQKVSDLTTFRFKIADYPPGYDVKLKVIQNGKEKTMKFKLADRSDFINKPASILKQSESWLGIEVKATTSREGRMSGVEDLKGVLVVNVENGSPAEGLLERGDVITEINGVEIGSVEDFQKVAADLKDRTRAIPFWIIRSGRRAFIPIKPVLEQ